MNATAVEAERATHLRQVDMENVSHRDRRSEGVANQIEDLVDVAIALDEAAESDIDNRGGSGMGAGAFVEAIVCTLDDDGNWNEDADDESGEQVSSINDPLFAHLPVGEAKYLRDFIARQRKRTCWDGNNHVEAPSWNSQELLNRIRGR